MKLLEPHCAQQSRSDRAWNSHFPPKCCFLRSIYIFLVAVFCFGFGFSCGSTADGLGVGKLGETQHLQDETLFKLPPQHTQTHTHKFKCPCKLTVSLMMCTLSAGLAKRVGARLLLASTSEVYGGKCWGP